MQESVDNCTIAVDDIAKAGYTRVDFIYIYPLEFKSLILVGTFACHHFQSVAPLGKVLPDAVVINVESLTSNPSSVSRSPLNMVKQGSQKINE